MRGMSNKHKMKKPDTGGIRKKNLRGRTGQGKKKKKGERAEGATAGGVKEQGTNVEGANRYSGGRETLQVEDEQRAY